MSCADCGCKFPPLTFLQEVEAEIAFRKQFPYDFAEQGVYRVPICEDCYKVYLEHEN